MSVMQQMRIPGILFTVSSEIVSFIA
jgi:hypothetical protein